MNRADKAVELFNNGYSCSQAVFAAFCSDLGLDRKLGLKIACSFGGGMGHLGQTCGAVTGAFMVLGLIKGMTEAEDKHSKEITYAAVNNFAAKFKKINGSINCTELVGYDLSNDEQIIEARKNDVFRKNCAKYVRDAVEILEEIILRSGDWTNEKK